MNSQTVEITSAGIRKILNKYTPERAIAEYVWNGFDAKATVVNIDFEIDNAELDTIKNIRITDNGTGICYEELPIKFKKFYESQKRIANENNTGNIRRNLIKNDTSTCCCVIRYKWLCCSVVF